MAPLHKICIWTQTQIRKIKRKLSFNQSESRIKDLRLIFLTFVPTQNLCNGTNGMKWQFMKANYEIVEFKIQTGDLMV